MTQAFTLVFWSLIFLVFYTYLGYGILLFFIVKLKKLAKNKREERFDFEPSVTLVIPAFNEEQYIKDKALNSLSLDYPKSKLRILFITDGSTDGTKEILQKIQGVEVIHEERRGGKSAAENRAMKYVQTPIVIFCDANTVLNKESVRELVKHYRDSEVGGVSGEKRISMDSQLNASGAGEGMYWKYESFLKNLDSELYTIVGAAGELVSFRTDLVEDLEEDTILDDFVQSLRICEKGYRMLYEPHAYAVEMSSENVKEELKRKIRIAAGGWQAMYRLRHLLNPFRNFVFTFQYISHRVLRWSISAFALPVIFLLNFLVLSSVIDGGRVYYILFLAQASFYLLAIVGWSLESKNIRIKAFFIPYYFTIMNYAVIVGFFKWLKGKQSATWEKSVRMKVENNQTL